MAYWGVAARGGPDMCSSGTRLRIVARRLEVSSYGWNLGLAQWTAAVSCSVFGLAWTRKLVGCDRLVWRRACLVPVGLFR